MVDQILLGIAGRFEDIQINQEDWGWFIWFKRGPVSLAIDVFCDDPEKGEFRVHLYAYRTRLFRPTNHRCPWARRDQGNSQWQTASLGRVVPD